MMKWRNDSMLLRIAQGDAFAAAVEYVDRDKHPRLFEEVLRFEGFLQHPTHLDLRPGMYTDDGQMSLGLAELLVHARKSIARGTFPSKEQYAEWFFQAFKRDPRDGYSRGFQKILEESTSSADMLRRLVPDSNKNGACMRAVPVGVLSDTRDVIKVAADQARLTHDTPGGVDSAVAVALMSHFALYDPRGFSELPAWGQQRWPAFRVFERPWSGPVTGGWKTKDRTGLGVGINTAWAVHTLLVEEPTLAGIMRRLIGWGGDTDSVAAVAWGIASARCQDEAMPAFLERDLEARGNLKYGPDYLHRVGCQLMDAYGGPWCKLP